MSTATVAPIKRRGNPNFGKKVSEEIQQEQNISAEIDKQYIFQLIKTHEKAKPKDDNGQIVGSPYQPFYAIVNSGTAWDPDFVTPTEARKPKADQKKGASRRWRLLANYPTIWVDEQIDPEPSKEDLADAANDLIFRNGVLRVFGHQATKLQAMQLNNAFQDCVRPLKNIVKEYVLLDQDKIDKEVLQALDDSFEAEKAAREASLQEMYAVSYYFGIDLTKSDDAIRKAFISIARAKPAVFNREFVNPKNKYKYLFLEALSDNIISGTSMPGKIVFTETGAVLFDLNTQDFAEELATMVVGNYEKAVNLFNKIKKIYEEAE